MGSYNLKRIGGFIIILISMMMIIILYTELLPIHQNIYAESINNDNSTNLYIK